MPITDFDMVLAERLSRALLLLSQKIRFHIRMPLFDHQISYPQQVIHSHLPAIHPDAQQTRRVLALLYNGI